MRSIFIYIIIITSVFLSSGCKETVDFYLGVPLQPDIEENNYEPGLNIIGVLRPDFKDTVNRSFVYIQEVAPALGSSPEFEMDSLIVKDAEVTILNESSGMETSFTWTNSDSIFSDKRYRPTDIFDVNAGSRYFITCSSKELPVLTSSTLVPNQPMVLISSINLTSNTISFETRNDSTIFLFEIYVYRNDTLNGFTRQLADSTNETSFSINFEGLKPNRIEVFGYDYNLSSYLTISNTNLNFNKYRKSFGNVEGGYGVFGSLNYISVPLK